MKNILFYSMLVLTLLNANDDMEDVSSNIQKDLKANKLSVSTDAKNNQCRIAIDENIIYQRKCEFEYNPKLIFYATFINYDEVWVFQDTPMGNACDGGTLRIFERKSGGKDIAYRGEIDFCGGPNPVFKLKRDTLVITDESGAKSYSLRQGKLKQIDSKKQK